MLNNIFQICYKTYIYFEKCINIAVMETKHQNIIELVETYDAAIARMTQRATDHRRTDTFYKRYFPDVMVAQELHHYEISKQAVKRLRGCLKTKLNKLLYEL